MAVLVMAVAETATMSVDPIMIPLDAISSNYDKILKVIGDIIKLIDTHEKI